MSADAATVLITGGASGIGLEIARAVTARGAQALIWDINAAKLAHAATELPGSVAICTDISDPEAITKAITQGPTPTHLVNNAGILGPDMPLNAANATTIDQVLGVNLRGTLLVTSAFLNTRAAHASGSIINMSSIAGFNGGAAGRAVYGASKGAILALTQAMARDLSPALRVTALAPGIIDTEIQTELFADRAALDTTVSNIPAARLGQPSEVANAALWLLFDAAYITGEVIRVAGGRK